MLHVGPSLVDCDSTLIDLGLFCIRCGNNASLSQTNAASMSSLHKHTCYTLKSSSDLVAAMSGASTKGGGLDRAEPSQPLKLVPPQKNTTDVAPPHMSYHRKFLPVGVSVTHVPVLLFREH